MIIPSLYLRPHVTRFVVLFVERSGSSALRSLMETHPDISAEGEVLGVMRHEGKSAAEQLAWANAFLTPPLVGRRKAIGFKTKLLDILDPPAFADLLRRHKCRIIQLQRRNAVKGVISTLNAKRQWEKSGAWNLLHESHRLGPCSVNLPEFDRLLSEREQLDTELALYTAQLNLPILQVYYEDLLQDEKTFVDRVFDFIQVRAKPVTLEILKNTKDNLQEAITNFDELKSHYAHTRYASMFDEVLVDTEH